MFQRNQMPMEQKIAMAFVAVLECVSMNLGILGQPRFTARMERRELTASSSL